MAHEMEFVFALILIAGALMASNRVRFDIVALLVVLGLMLSGVLTPGQALAGFGSSVVILVAGLLVIGEMLARTGVALAVGDWILKKGGSNEIWLLILIMAGAGLLGAFMSSTAVVAIFIPIVLRIAQETGLSASRMLLPMSYAALISGMLTLIATAPNIVVHEELRTSGYEGFGFFGFTVVGAMVLVVAIVYFLLIGRRLLPVEKQLSGLNKRARSLLELWEDFRAGGKYDNLRISSGSPLIGKSIAQTRLESRYQVRIIGIMRRSSGSEVRIPTPSPSTVLSEDDTLLVIGDLEDDQALMEEQKLTRVPGSKQNRQRWLWELGAASVLIHPESTLIGKSLRETEFRSKYNIHVLGFRRDKKPEPDFKDTKLRASDSLLVIGPWTQIQQLQTHTHDFVVLEQPREMAEIVPSYRRMPIALIILVTMVLLTIFDIVPLVAAVLMAALAAVFTRCITMQDAYRAIHWSSLVLVAGMLPLADALNSTGGTQFIVDNLLAVVGESGPYVMLTVIFFLTAGLGLVLSNTASAVLVAPIAIYAATAIGVSPYPFGIAVLIAASAAYSTPVSTPVVTLVVDPGNYKFMDFVKAGLPLLFLTYLVTLLVAPMIFPFYA
ncbi:MAG: SLC13 family permease [Gammaproteobacteria bacterium]|nr:SLC13 family permease [Gammaproteobacteria bacterium]